MTSPGLSWSQARAIAGDVGPLPPVPTGLGQALGSVLAHDLRPPAGLPAADTAAMDGFAICGPGPGRIVDALLAGQVRTTATGNGEAVGIATGAAIPPGAHAVLRYEDTGRSPCGEITGRAELGRHIRRAGSDLCADDVLVPSGDQAHGADARAGGVGRLR